MCYIEKVFVFKKKMSTRKVNKSVSKAAYKKIRPKNIGRYKYVPTLSNTHHAVYRNPENKIILGVRGTRLTDTKDLKADYNILRGKKLESTERYMKAEQALKGLLQSYGADNVSVTGHSLGGTIAAELQETHLPHTETFVFNPGVGLGHKLSENENLKTEVNAVDPISFFGNTGKNTVYSKNSLSSVANLTRSLMSMNPIGVGKSLLKAHKLEDQTSVADDV